jgi:hypothetical protein
VKHNRLKWKSTEVRSNFQTILKVSFDLKSSEFEYFKLAEQNKIGIRNEVQYSIEDRKFKLHHNETSTETKRNFSSILHYLSTCFLPSGKLTKDYYSYTLWRLAQRFVSATSSVFGTQALLLALGFKKSRIGINDFLYFIFTG